MFRWIAALFGLGLLAGLGVYVLVINKPHLNVERTEAAYAGTAAQLLQTLEEGGPVAEALIGAVVEVSGQVESVASGEGSTVLTLDAGNPMGGGLSASMAESYSPDADPVGEQIVLKGICAGLSASEGGLLDALGSTVQLTDCIVHTP